MKKFLLCLILTSAAFGLTFGQAKKKPPLVILGTTNSTKTSVAKLSPEAKRRLETFQIVWKTIKDNYFDQTFSGLDWEKIRLEYEPQILKTTTDEELHDILHLMVNRLNRSHFAIIPPDVYSELEKAKAKAGKKDESSMSEPDGEFSDEVGEDGIDAIDTLSKYGIGVDLRLINNQFVITRVESGSSGDKAGLKPGFVIEKINDMSLKELMEKLQNWKGTTESIKRMLPLEVIDWFLNGDEETSVDLVVLNEKEQAKQIQVKRERLNGKMISMGSDFPAQFSSFETKSLNADVGYIKFNLFALSTIEEFCASLTALKDKKAIIIDLRGNVGGLIGATIGVSGMLTDKSMELGTQIYKIGTEKLTAFPKAKNYKGKLVFLTDSLSISSAELLAAAMQENNRALIVGEKSAGEALPSLSIVLPTGAVLLYPIANFKTPKGNFIEGKGVVPNFVVALDKKSLLEGRDNQIETALRVIKEDSAFPKQIVKTIETQGIGALSNMDEPIIAKPTSTPKPVPMLPPKRLAVVTVLPPNIEISKSAKDEKDTKSIQVIADFINAIGGEEALKKVESYQLEGSSQLEVRGSTLDTDISVYRQKPNKYAFIMKAESIGEVREVYNDKIFFVQSDFGMVNDYPFSPDTAKVEIFSPIYSLLDKENFKALKYLGEFEREGKKSHLIEAKISEYVNVTLAFDVETKMLTGFATPLSTVYLSDYRKIDNIMLPFEILRDSRMKIFLTNIKLNQKIDESVFIKKENCFDRAN